MRLIHLSAIVLIINENSVLTVEGAGQTPVAADIHAPVTLEFAAQLMQTPPGAFLSCGDLALPKAKSYLRSRSVCCG